MYVGHIEGGTHAGWRNVKQVSRENWTCPDCGKTLRYYWSSCPLDSAPRPENH